ncbi:hypothetical protein [Psychromarinibacter sp. S121]|uniref:hypothetical protein n=1 Tax=Psychromarinibacter sp. S121 TaxID=3415127 RepID=UPI003C7C723B
MTPADVETVYETLALQLDAVDAEKRELFLAKLALLLAHDVGDAGHACLRIHEAAEDLDV